MIVTLLTLWSLTNNPTKGSEFVDNNWASLDQQQVDRKGKALVRLRLIIGSRPIWSRTVDEVQRIGWSSNRNALVVAIHDSAWEGYRLLIWRAGASPKLVQYEPKYGEDDGIIDFMWSPDTCHVLFRTYGSGGRDLNTGTLWCLSVRDLKAKAGPRSVRRMTWIGERTIRYWVSILKSNPSVSGSQTLVTSSTARVWKCR